MYPLLDAQLSCLSRRFKRNEWFFDFNKGLCISFVIPWGSDNMFF